MSDKRRPYKHFVDTELFQPNSMSYLEEAFESMVDGDESVGLATQLRPYLVVPTKHRQICAQLQGRHAPVQIQQAAGVLEYYRRNGHLFASLGLFTDSRVKPPMFQVSGMLTGSMGGEELSISAQSWQR